MYMCLPTYNAYIVGRALHSYQYHDRDRDRNAYMDSSDCDYTTMLKEDRNHNRPHVVNSWLNNDRHINQD